MSKNRTDVLDSERAVTELYELLLGRQPDPEGLRYWSLVADGQGIARVYAGIQDSDEFRARDDHELLETYRGYYSRELSLVNAFANPHAKPHDGFVVDFMGGRLRTESLWEAARIYDGQVLPPPIPADFHSEAIEWIGVLKSVITASGRFVAMELGAGLGPWVVAGGLAARLRRIDDVQLYAVEADPVHYNLLQQNIRDNGFQPNECITIHAAIGTQRGKVPWPVIRDPREDWGSRPLEEIGTGSSDYLGRRFEDYIEIDILPFNDLLSRERYWNMIHIDIQGHETAICENCLNELNARAHWLVIGTHSRVIEGHLISLFSRAGWILENEKPCKFKFDRQREKLEAMTYIDGVQVWRNPQLDSLPF